jgi:Family of unknown function (DUF6497)
VILRATLLLAVLAALPAVAEDGPIPVPSGQTVTWVDTIHDARGPAGLTLRFRFLAPAIARAGGTVSAEVAQADMQALCDGWALARIASTGPRPAQVVISLSDRKVAFGEPDPEATQFFEAYSIETGACVPEVF